MGSWTLVVIEQREVKLKSMFTLKGLVGRRKEGEADITNSRTYHPPVSHKHHTSKSLGRPWNRTNNVSSERPASRRQTWKKWWKVTPRPFEDLSARTVVQTQPHTLDAIDTHRTTLVQALQRNPTLSSLRVSCSRMHLHQRSYISLSIESKS